MAQTKLDFARYKLTAASIQWETTAGTYATGEKFGCTGSIGSEPNVKSITIDCEGDEVDVVDITQYLDLSIGAHISMGVYRKIYGLEHEELATGVHGYKKDSMQGSGILTFELTDLYNRDRLLVAFPRVSFTGGFRFVHDNTGTEIAQLEMTAKAYADANDYFYYESEKSKVSEDIKTAWHTAFTPNLMLKIPQG